jgi:small membrane protein
MKLLIFKILLIAGLAVILRIYLAKARSVLRDRLLGLGMFAGLLGTVLYPQATTWLAHKLGVGRGTDLVFYLAFVFILFLMVTLNAHRLQQEQWLTQLVREVALLRARVEGQDGRDSSALDLQSGADSEGAGLSSRPLGAPTDLDQGPAL